MPHAEQIWFVRQRTQTGTEYALLYDPDSKALKSVALIEKVRIDNIEDLKGIVQMSLIDAERFLRKKKLIK